MVMESLKATPGGLVLINLALGRDKGLDVLAELQRLQPSMPMVASTAIGVVNM